MSGVELLKAVKAAHNVSYMLSDSQGFRGTRIGKDSDAYVVYLIFDTRYSISANHSVKSKQIPESIDNISIRLLFE